MIGLSQIEACCGSVLNPLVTVEQQFCGDLLCSHDELDSLCHKLNGLLCAHFVSNDAAVVKAANHGQIEYALSGMEVGDVHYPFLIWTQGGELTIRQMGVFMQMLNYLPVFAATANSRQQTIS